MRNHFLDFTRITLCERKRRTFGGTTGDEQEATIFERCKLLIEHKEQADAGKRHTEGSDKDGPRPLQHIRQRAFISRIKLIKFLTQHTLETARRRLVPQQTRAKHGCQRQSHETRHQHGRRKRQRKFEKEFTRAARRKSHRRVNRRQRQRHGNHGESNFLRSFDRAFNRCHTVFDVAENVFEHNNGIVHHKADGQHHRKQRQRVDAESKREHETKSADERHRDRHYRNKRCSQRAQKEKDDEHDEHNGFGDGLVNRLDGFFDEDRTVKADMRTHAGRQIGRHLLERRLHGLRHFKRIGGCLLHNADGDRGYTIISGATTHVSRSDFDLRDIAQPHLIVARLLDDDLTKLFRRRKGRLGQHREFTVLALDAA